MFNLAYFCLFISASYAAIPAKNYTDTRGVDIGIKAMSRDQIVLTTECAQQSFFDQADLMTTGYEALSCAMTAMGSTQVASLALILPGLETCFIFSGTLTIVVTAKAGDVLYAEFSEFYNKMMDTFTKLKDAGKKHDEVLQEGYKMINQRYTRQKINELCLKIAKKLSKSQFACLMNNGKPVLDVTDYDCARYVKADLLG